MLPANVILEAYPSDTYEKLGGFALMAGIDPDDMLLSTKIKDHPWLGLEVVFPFPEVGTGKISQCIRHPQGPLLFDVEFPEPVPTIISWYAWKEEPGGCEVILKDRPNSHSTTQRFHAKELLGIINGDWIPYITHNGRRVPLNNKETKQ